MNLDPIFFALSDPTRRQVLESIRLNPQAVGQIASGLPVTRPAVSQHLKILKDANLVAETRHGTRNIYAIDPQGIALMRDYFNDYWDIALDRFQTFAEKTASDDNGQVRDRLENLDGENDD
jgi:DNA-binding transcriptional ArsR family regulator